MRWKVRKIERINEKVFVLLVYAIINWAVVFSSGFAYAGASITLTGGNWDITEAGTVVIAAGETVTSTGSPTTWEVTGSSDGIEDIYARVSSTGSWEGSTTTSNGVNIFVLIRKHASDADVVIPTDAGGSGNVIKSDLAIDGTYYFGLQFTAPALGSASEENQLTVTLTAINWYSCAGWGHDGKCWYYGTTYQSCDTVCASHGGCIPDVGYANCAVCQHWYPSVSCNYYGQNYGESYMYICDPACMTGPFTACSWYDSFGFMRRFCRCAN